MIECTMKQMFPSVNCLSNEQFLPILIIGVILIVIVFLLDKKTVDAHKSEGDGK